MSQNNNLLFRTDYDSNLGLGHVMRCFALAQTWIDQGSSAIFAIAKGVDAITERLESEGIRVVQIKSEAGSYEDAIQTLQLARQAGCAWVVVDGYHIDGSYRRTLRSGLMKVLMIDDIGSQDCSSDIVLNQNFHATRYMYGEVESGTVLLLGTRYVLLRREFHKWAGWHRQISKNGRKLLVTVGGGDPDNITFKVIGAMNRIRIENLDVVVVVGAANHHYEMLDAARRKCRYSIRLERNSQNIAELMACADVAISAAGSTCWELAFMQLPTLTIITAPNQEKLSKLSDGHANLISLGQATSVNYQHLAEAAEELLINHEMRRSLAFRGASLVDGKGAFRVAQTIMSYP